MRTVLVEGDPRHQKPGKEAAHGMADLQFLSLGAAVDALLQPD
jgi:hypothetical protein